MLLPQIRYLCRTARSGHSFKTENRVNLRRSAGTDELSAFSLDVALV